MTRRAAVLVLFTLALAQSLAGQTIAGSPEAPQSTGIEASILFISSQPFGAQVWLDGVALPGLTPMLLRDVAPGAHELRIERMGYFPVRMMVDPATGNYASASLEPERVVLRFDQDSVRVAGKPVDAGDDSVSFQAGALEFKPGPEGLDIIPVYKGQGLLDGVRFSMPLFLGLSGLLTLREISLPRDSDYALSPELAAASLISAGLLFWDLVLEAKRNRYLEEYRAQTSAEPNPELDARTRFEAAIESMGSGRFDAALSQFESITEDYSDSEWTARAIFEAGRIMLMRGDLGGASNAYALLVERYPIPELYDRALKGLSDCAFASGDPRGALGLLDLLTFTESSLSREEVELHRAQLLLSVDAQ